MDDCVKMPVRPRVLLYFHKERGITARLGFYRQAPSAKIHLSNEQNQNSLEKNGFAVNRALVDFSLLSFSRCSVMFVGLFVVFLFLNKHLFEKEQR